MPRVAIQSAFYHSSRDLPMVLQSLKQQTFIDWKLYVYENSCDAAEVERERQILDASGVPYEWVIGEKNTGFSAHNHLLALHDAEFIFILNDDAYLEPECLEALIRRAESDAKCAAVTGVVYRWTVASEERQPFNDDTIVDTAGLEYRSLANVVDMYAGQRYGDCRHGLTDAHKLFGVSGAVALYRRAAFLDVSPERCLYEPTFFMYKEDTELALRLQRKGYSAWFEPKAVAFHRRAIKLEPTGMWGRIQQERKRPAHLREIMYRNQWMIYAYHVSPRLGIKDLVLSVCYEIPRGVLVFLASPSLFFRAWFRIFHDVPAAWRRRNALYNMGLHRIHMV